MTPDGRADVIGTGRRPPSVSLSCSVGLSLPRLHVLTLAGGPEVVLASVDAALVGGAPLVQLRVKVGTDRARLDLARSVVTRCHESGAWCLVNDRADIALAAGADGVHLGADDLPVAAVRAIVGEDLVVGATARDPEAGRRAEAEGADYLGVGPAYATSTKVGLPDAIGPEGVGRVARAVGIPVVAIGGVTGGRIPSLLEAGAYGVAVAGAVFAGAEPGRGAGADGADGADGAGDADGAGGAGGAGGATESDAEAAAPPQVLAPPVVAIPTAGGARTDRIRAATAELVAVVDAWERSQR